ncbi:MAG: hypothetical protein DRQ37_07660 [Gammaproteobacteria bacterium]|nr:MAG: hypothetical protein DRQ37_07660 [Gammaproteobacteria bacterium]
MNGRYKSKLVGMMLLAWGIAPVFAEEPPCTRTEFQIPHYQKACEQGQKSALREALRFVKDVTKARRAAGEKNYRLACDECHTTRAPDYQTKPDAVERANEFYRLLGR